MKVRRRLGAQRLPALLSAAAMDHSTVLLHMVADAA